jgi:hypothetical protein
MASMAPAAPQVGIMRSELRDVAVSIVTLDLA